MGATVMLDIISSDIGQAGEMEFTAAAAPPLEVLILPPGATPLRFSNSDDMQLFQPGDNLLLQRLWCNIPFGFAAGTGRTRIAVLWRSEAGENRLISELGDGTFLTVPDVCGGIVFPGSGLFLRTPTDMGLVGLVLTALTNENMVSMVNLPADLVGAVIKVQWSFMVQHTRPMTFLG